MASSADIEYALDLLRGRQARDRLYANYYAGRFNLEFASSSFRAAFGSLVRKAGYNRCRTVVDALADRTAIIGWQATAAGDEIAKKANDLWTANRMENRQNEIFKEAFRAGDAYAIVWPDETGKARIHPNRAHTVVVVYDDEDPGRIEFALKCWQLDRGPDKGRWRVTVYEADALTRYITIGKKDNIPEKYSSLTAYEADGQPETRNEWGIVPVVHFANDADTGSFGTSELADVVPLQDALNKAISDQMVAEEFVAYPQRWAIGVETDPDEESPFRPGIDRLWTVGDENARFGQFDPADMAQFIVVQDSWDMKIARTSRTPVHWLTQTNIPISGEALKTAEAPFVAKEIDRQKCFTDPAADMSRIALIQEGATLADVATLEPIWQSPEARSEREFWTIAQLKIAAGIPEEIVWAEGGYTTEQITAMKAMNDAARERALVGTE